MVNLDLAAVGGGGDGQADTIIANATGGDDVVLAVGDASGVSVLGLAAQINITGFETANDRLVVNLGAGDDVFEGSGLAASSIQLTVDGGDGNDILIGSAGNDVLLGGAGDDVLIGNGGVDVLDGGTGDDVIIAGLGANLEIRGFVAGEDRLDLRAFGDHIDFAWLAAHAREVNGDTVLDFDGQQVTLLDIQAGIASHGRPPDLTTGRASLATYSPDTTLSGGDQTQRPGRPGCTPPGVAYTVGWNGSRNCQPAADGGNGGVLTEALSVR